MYRHFLFQLTLMVAVTLMVLSASCGGGQESATSDQEWARQSLSSDLFERQAAAPAAPAPAVAPAAAPRQIQAQSAPTAPAPAALPAPAAAAAPAIEKVEAQMASVATDHAMSEAAAPAQLVTQRRIIIREVDMSLVVDEIQTAIDEIADIADDAGGWVVDSGRWALHIGSISIRVPADVLDDTIDELRDLATKVESENTSSRDVTDEYVDLGARLTNQRATQQALLGLLERATNVEAALEVQRDLSRVQEEVERLSGRIKFLEESAAFSIIRVSLSLAPVEVSVDSGPDQTVAVHVPVKFRATFTPPEGIEDYSITWDFGDASDPHTIYRTAPTQTPGELTTATVNHVYDSTTGSPFIAQVTITGTGEGGIIEGEDTLTVSVSEVPAIEVFAGDWMDVEQNTEVSFSGSFTRPQGLTDVRFEWDFGDGLPPVTGDVPEGSTRAYATHVYRDYRPEPYTARLTVTAESEVGQIEASRSIEVFVREELGFVVGGYDFADSLKGATRGLSELVQGLLVVLIWLVIFLPIWAVAGGVIWFVVRLARRRRARNEVSTDGQQMDAAS